MEINVPFVNFLIGQCITNSILLAVFLVVYTIKSFKDIKK